MSRPRRWPTQAYEFRRAPYLHSFERWLHLLIFGGGSLALIVLTLLTVLGWR